MYTLSILKLGIYIRITSMNNEGKSVYLNENIRLYKQKRSPFWWVNVRLDSQQKRLSTKVKIEDDTTGTGKARDKALAIETELKVMVKHGIDLIKTPSFSHVADKVITKLNSKSTQREINKDYIRIIENHLKPYFKHAAINKVDRYRINNFFDWREEKYQSAISLTQKRVTNTAITLIFELACDLGYIKQHEIPKLPKVKTKPKRAKDYFNDDEVNAVQKGFEGFIKTARNRKSHEIRTLLELYVYFILGTGARPGEEVINLTYGDIGRERVEMDFRWSATITTGKTSVRKGARKIILSDLALDALNEVVKHRPYFDSLSLLEVIKKYPNEVIFTVDYRNSPPDFGKSFNQYLKYLNMNNKNHSLYSLRHTYITRALLSKSQKMTKRMIAKQCGTSEEMINQYYDHVEAMDFATELARINYLPSLRPVTLDRFFE